MISVYLKDDGKTNWLAMNGRNFATTSAVYLTLNFYRYLVFFASPPENFAFRNNKSRLQRQVETVHALAPKMPETEKLTVQLLQPLR